MRFAALLSFCVVAFATAIFAQTLPAEQRAEGLGGLRALGTADAARDWTGVGRLDTGVSFCTATLIAPELVLTAAHCLFDPESGARLRDGDLVFSAGLRNGRAEALRGVRQAHLTPGYDPTQGTEIGMIARDLALLELDLPIRTGRIAPIPSGRGARPRTQVTVVSYGENREIVASIEEDCEILQGQDTVRSLSCRVDHGSSGAPVVRMTATGPEIIAVMSAMGRSSTGDAMSLAVVLDGPLADLLEMRAGTDGQGQGVTLIRPGAEGRGRLSGHFIRP
jgi:V8-like Glu-specific endopeptidase